MSIDAGNNIAMTMLPTELHVQVRLEDGWYWATVEQFPGVFASGQTEEELRESLEEAIKLYVADDDGNGPDLSLSAFSLPPMETTASAELACA